MNKNEWETFLGDRAVEIDGFLSHEGAREIFARHVREFGKAYLDWLTCKRRSKSAAPAGAE